MKKGKEKSKAKSRGAFKFQVFRNGQLYSDHTTRELAEERIARYISMSNGRLSKDDFTVEVIDKKKDSRK